MKSFDLSLYLILDPRLCTERGMVETTLEAVAGGATMVQLRDKQASTAELVESGRAIMAALSRSGVPLIVNDDVEAAVAIGANGVHVGQADSHPRAAREAIGPGRILGLSVETEALAARVDPAIVDYVGVGPVFATPTKPDHEPPIGIVGLARLVMASPAPAVAIGGLAAEHAAAVLATGARGLAVISAVCGQPDPRLAARRLADAIREAGR